MKRALALVFAMVLALGAANASALGASGGAGGLDEIITIRSFDGVSFDGRLRLPPGEKVDKLVIYVNGSGPNTYDNRTQVGEGEFRYHDLFADELNGRGIGYFSYNTRGVTPNEEPPNYCTIDEEGYKSYKPSNEIRDIPCIINQLKALPPLKDAKVILLGWSAGAMIAPQVALQGEAPVDMLVLAGYPNDTLADILQWQLNGGSSMVFFLENFDVNGDGAVDRDEYEADPEGMRVMLGDITFDQLDQKSDGVLTAEDLGLVLEQTRKQIFGAFETGDDEWLKANYPVRLTSGWYLDYANIAPNSQVLPKLDLPIHIFQGQYDQNTPVEGAQSIERDFKKLNKHNLTVHIYPADHSLKYLAYWYNGKIPKPIADMLDVIAAF